MKKRSNKKTSLSANIYIPILMVVALLIVMSCSTSGTAKQDRFTHSSQFKKSKKKSKTVTKPLFMQSEKANLAFVEKIDFFDMYNIPAESNEGSIVLPEDDYLLEFVDIPGFSSLSATDTESGDTTVSKTFEYLKSLPHVFEVLKSSKKCFITDRNDNNIKLDFKIVVPKQLLSSKWRLLMSPELIKGDSIITLAPLRITGEEFAQKQVLDDENYKKFLNSLVLRGNYSEVFTDRKRTREELKKLQDFYWNSYQKEWAKQVEFEKWKFNRQDQDAFYAAKRMGTDDKTYHENALTALNMVARDYAAGKDTVGMFNKYFNELQSKAKKYYKKGTENAELNVNDIPKKFRNAYMAGKSSKDIKNLSTTRLDSVRFAKHLYDYDEVALNEVTVGRLNEIRDEIMKYPLEENESFVLDSVILNNNNDFVYYYSKEVLLSKDLDSLKLSMKSKVEAVDLSTFTMAPSDTLTYYVSNMNQLGDSTLAATKVRVFRNVYDLITIQPKYKVNSAEFDVNFGDNRAQADSVFRTYNRNRHERGLRIDSVILKGAASLEGTYDKNLDLARRRSFGMKEFLKGVLPSEADVENTFVVKYIGEDWDGMRRELNAHPGIKNKKKILELLDTSIYPDQTEQEIKRKYSADYAIILRDIYPKLRKIDLVFNMSRPSMGVADSIFSDINTQYAYALEQIKSGNFAGALQTLEEYQDYNTALCYANLNEYSKAYNLLKTLESNGYTEYLSAIVAYRLGYKQEGVQHLLEACRVDFRQAYRILANDEVASMVTEFELQNRIKEILKAADAPVVPEVKVTDIEVTEGPGGVEGVSRYNPEDDERIGTRVGEDQEIIE